jgi:type VI secretion system protein VasD
MVWGNRARVVVAFAALLLLSSCGGASPPPPPPVVELTLNAAPNINPDPAGRPAPVLVRIYQLASANKFELADFYQLSNNEAATLDGDLLGRDELILSPGQSRHLTLNMKHDATRLGIAVAFRQIDRAKWRADTAFAPSGVTNVTATISGLNLTLVRH